MASKQHAKPHLPQEESALSIRRGYARLATEELLGAASGAFMRAGFPDASLVTRWAAIAGPDVARLASPLKWQEGAEGAVLTLQCEAAAAVFLQHETRRLIERLNSYLGPGRIARIRVVPGRRDALPEPSPHPGLSRPKAPLFEEAEKPGLKPALSRLGNLRNSRKSGL